MRKALLFAGMLALSVVPGATVFRDSAAWGAQAVDTHITNLDGNRNLRVHEQGTAAVGLSPTANTRGAVPVATAKRRCGRKTRSCPLPLADLELTFGTHAVADYGASGGGTIPVAVVVRVANHGPARAVGALMTVSYPRRYVRPEAAVFTKDSCSDSVPSAPWATLVCPIGSITRGAGVTVRVAFDLGAAVPRKLKIGFTVLSLTRDARLGNNFAHATPDFVGCAASYPTICVPPPPPSLACADIAPRNFRTIHTVPAPDPQRFDPDHDGIGCET